MGFMDFMGKMIKGEPVYSTPKADKPVVDDWDDRPVIDPKEVKEQKEDSIGQFDEHGNKIIPVISVTGVDNHFSGEQIETWIQIANESEKLLELDKITVFGHKTELDHQLKIGEEREFKIYSGPHFSNNYYHTAEIYYKVVDTGDYFCARFQIEYHVDSHDTFTPEEFKPILPIKDV